MRFRFYYPQPWPHLDIDRTDGATFALPESIFRHAITVLRMKVGDICELFDGAGLVAEIEIAAVEKKSAQARWRNQSTQQTENESPLNITLIQCISSAEKMDWTIEKAVELGVNQIVPVFSARSQVKLSAERIDKKIQHWQRIIIAACAQSGRNICPNLIAPMPLRDWLAISHPEPVYPIILHPGLQKNTTLSQLPPPADNAAIHILIGPESGFDEAEIALAMQASYQTSLLGKRILRTETAGLATISALQTLWGDF